MPAPVQLPSDSPALVEVLDLIRRSFADMEGRIDPPSSMHHLTVADLAAQAETGEVWAIGTPVVACVVLTARTDVLYLGKLAVAADQRGTGLARQLVELAAERARAHGLEALELQTRVELLENHATFTRLGFVQTATCAHPGYTRPTSVVLRRTL